MKNIFIIIMLLSLFIIGCTTNITEEAITKESASLEIKENIIPTTPETIALCNSYCYTNAEEYCFVERTILVNNIEVTGTCRAFSQTDHKNDFKRCQKFCNQYPKSTTQCTINGDLDVNCDGIKD